MIRANAVLRYYNGPTAFFDIEPWLEHASPILPSPDMDCSWTILPFKLGTQCLRWTMENYPTSKLNEFLAHVGMKEVHVDSDDLLEWVSIRRTKKIAKNAVDKLMGGEP